MKKILILVLFSFACFFITENVNAFSFSVYPSSNEGLQPSAPFPINTWKTLNWNTSGTHSLRFHFNSEGFLPNSSVHVTHTFCTIITNKISGENVINFTQNADDCPTLDYDPNVKRQKFTLSYDITNVMETSTIEGSYPIGFNQELQWNGYPSLMYMGSTYCLNGSAECESLKKQQEIEKQQQQTNEKLDDLNQNITDSSIDSSSANGFFNKFEDDDYGLSSIITAPLKLVQKLNNNQCTDLSIPLPYVKNQNLKLPCMSTYYKSNFNSLFMLYQTITTGFIAYWICIRIYALVKGFKDPEDDKIEVMDL